jgi:Fic-DOC domain mobile mystery protein B
MGPWESLPGETPIDPSGLRRRGSITNRGELAAAEARNINKAFLKYLATKPSERAAPFDFEWFLDLHREMFGEIWTWAGVVRTRDLNLGAPHHQVVERLAALVGDLHSWTGYGHSLEMQAVWLHHRSVEIHPFENGNGRWARLLANIWLKRHEEPIVFWPDQLLGAASAIRSEYLAAVQAADRGDYDALAELHRRFVNDMWT